jgi:hypothetical protein
MNDYYSISKRQLSLQIETLIFACLQASFSIGSSCVACTITHFDSRTGLLSVHVYPYGANQHLFNGRIELLITCDQDSRDKLATLNTYLLDVLNNGYSRFTGFPDQPLAIFPTSKDLPQPRAHAPS